MDRQNFINRHIELAIKAAHLGIHRQHRVGAILTKNGKVLSVGANNGKKSHPLMAGFKALHAEVNAIIGVRWSDLSGAIIITARINGTGKVGMSKPCSTCQDVLRRYGVRKAYYTTADGIGELKLS